MRDTAKASSAQVGSRNTRGGIVPMTTSRSTPPPVAVMMPSMATPKRSMPWRMASIAPEMAKETVPMISKIEKSKSMCPPVASPGKRASVLVLV